MKRQRRKAEAADIMRIQMMNINNSQRLCLILIMNRKRYQQDICMGICLIFIEKFMIYLRLQQIEMRSFEPIKEFQLLPRNHQVKKFLHKFIEDDEYDLIQQCYYINSSLKEAYLMVILCLGGPEIPDQIQKEFFKNQSIPPQKLARLKSMADKFVWKSNSNSTKIFMENSQIYKSQYYHLSEQLYPYFNQKKVQSLYKTVCSSSDYLFGTRIREFIKTDYIERANRRNKQKQEEEVLKGNNYLFIHQKQPDYVIVGVFRTQKNYHTETESVSPSPKPQTPRNSMQIEHYKDQAQEDQTKKVECPCCIF